MHMYHAYGFHSTLYAVVQMSCDMCYIFLVKGLTGSSDRHQLRTDYILTTNATPTQR